MIIQIDTREQKPYEFDEHDCEHTALDTGDYSVEGVNAAIERKTASDFLSSITWERERFERECERASEFDEEMVILIEKPRDYFAHGRYRRDVHPNSVMATIESWTEKYNIRFIFEENRQTAKLSAKSLLRNWSDDGSRFDYSTAQCP